MKNKFFIFALLCTILLFGQEEKGTTLELEDGLVNAALFLNTKLGPKLSLQNGLEITKNYHFNLYEVPLFLRYDLNDKWQIFAGPKLNYFQNSHNVTGLDVNSLRVSAEIGAQYQFTERIFGKFSYEYGLSKAQNDFNLGLLNNKGGVFKFGAGFKF